MDDVLGATPTYGSLHCVQHQLGAQMFAIDQPTILRLQASSTTARYKNPAAVDALGVR